VWQLVLETSGRTVVGLLKNGSLHEQLDLGVGRAQNRWLLPRIHDLLSRAGLEPKQLAQIVVSQGPGSYTGLRVGLTVAKTLAYALDCPLKAVPTFTALAQEHRAVESLVILGDALNQTCYVQRYRHGVETAPLQIQHVDEVKKSLIGNEVVLGPQLLPTPALVALASAATTLPVLNQAELYALEPLYLRGSSAEEKLKT
jgi:tRNA threonylcarbamoyladenosine biosynthesis protein TsaB